MRIKLFQLFLGFLQAFLEVALLHGLLLVGLDGGTHLVLVDHLAEDEHLDEGDDVDQHVIIAQARRIVIEDGKEHDGHQVHHPLHGLHLRVARIVHLLVVHPSVDERGDGHQDGEKAEVVHAEELWELYDAIIG